MSYASLLTAQLFDHDGSGQIDFREFVVSMWNYCTFTQQALVEFAFDLYDLDGSGEIDLKEMQLIVKEVYGDSFRTSQYAKKIMEKVAQLGQDSGDMAIANVTVIDKPQFARFTQKHPAMLFPAFRLQQELQKRVMGIQFWKKAAKKRDKLFADSTNLKEFMSKINETAFMDLATFEEVGGVEGMEAKYGAPPTEAVLHDLDNFTPGASGGAGRSPKRRSSQMSDSSGGMKRSRTMHNKRSSKVGPDLEGGGGEMRKVKTHSGDLNRYNTDGDGGGGKRRSSKARRSSRRPDGSTEKRSAHGNSSKSLRQFKSEASISTKRSKRESKSKRKRTSSRLSGVQEVW